jgi:hypothetical protein
MAPSSADVAAALADLSASSLRGAPLSHDALLKDLPAAGETPGLGGSRSAAVAADDEEALSAVAVSQASKKSGKQKGGKGATASAASAAAEAVHSAASLPPPLDAVELQTMQHRVSSAVAPLHEKLRSALVALRDMPPTWHSWHLTSPLQALCKGNVSLLAACQLAGLWKGLADDAPAAVASTDLNDRGVTAATSAVRSPVAAEVADATDSTVSPEAALRSTMSQERPATPLFALRDFLPQRSSELLYSRRFKDYSRFMHPSPPVWKDYADAIIRRPLEDPQNSLASLLQVSGCRVCA